MTYFIENLREDARKLALTRISGKKKLSVRLFLTDFNQDMASLHQFADTLQENPASCGQLAENWLLDNGEFIDEQAFEVSTNLSNALLDRLPCLDSGALRIQSIVSGYLTCVDGVISDESLIAYINAYQEISALTIAEIRTIPLVLRAALIHRFAEMMQELRVRKEICHDVDQFMAQLDTQALSSAVINEALDRAGQKVPLSGAWIVHLISHLREFADDNEMVNEWLSCRFENQGDLNKIVSYEHDLQSSYQMVAGNLITSLRKNERRAWDDIFSNISVIDRIFHDEPTSVYREMDQESRNQLLNKVELLGQKLYVPERLIAERVVQLASDEVTNEKMRKRMPRSYSRQTFIAYYLCEDKGVKILARSLKNCCNPKAPAPNLTPKSEKNYFIYLTGFTVVFALMFTLWLSYGKTHLIAEWLLIISAACFLAGEWMVTWLHTSIELTVKPEPLLRYDFANGIPDDAKTLVTIPVIWSTNEEVSETAERLELHYLSCRDDHIYFALLGDFVDSDQEGMTEKDRHLYAFAKETIAQLNAKYPKENGHFFHLFQRMRSHNERDGIFMGWERKRGKLIEFVEMIHGKQDTHFQQGELSSANELPSYLHDIRYIITLDADTELPMGNAHRMIASMHLPFNRPRLNAKCSRVIEGYAMMQPRVAVSLESSRQSKLTSFWTDAGLDPYAFAAADPYQDAVGHGIFTGKGIFEIETFGLLLSNRFPDNQILSHDLLEGSFLRAGFLSDIELIDAHPNKFSAYQKRMHRWVRGDWQLVKWLFPTVRNRANQKEKTELAAISRWQIIENLRRSLLPIAYYLLLVIAIFVFSGMTGIWLSLIFLSMSLPILKQISSMFEGGRMSKGFVNTVLQVLINFWILPFQAAVVVHAVSVSLYRQLISKKHLLEWTSSSHIEKMQHRSDQRTLEGITGGYTLIILFSVLTFIYQPFIPFVFCLALCLFWALAPLGMRYLDRPTPQEELTIADEDRAILLSLAEDIWRFYEEFADEENHWLPPDNVQFDPDKGAANRTSPTNIGYLFTAILAAEQFGFISITDVVQKIERVLQTLKQMQKWNGHLFNWYDTISLTPLAPRYVSTVDSGNFVASLMATKQGLDVLRETKAEEATAERLALLSEALEQLISATNFRALYNEKAKLFVLGYNDVASRHDDILYDLLASEARQTSFVAIALGQVPVSHWMALGRSTKRLGNHMALLSWSGTMFEYLMPWQLLRTFAGTVWESTYKGIVGQQIDYAHAQGVPFGISESGYYGFDFQMNYQYYAFGVPDTGFKRGLGDELVLAPYATIMALPFALEAGLRDLGRMAKLGARGKYGFFEAIDFTKKRMPEDEDYMIVKSCMAHHQGMSLLTLVNLLHQNKMVELFHRDMRVRSAELLLKERIPTKASKIHEHVSHEEKKQTQKKAQHHYKRRYESAEMPVDVNIHSNGRLTSLVTTQGAGFLQFDGVAITRWREQSPLSWGNFLYIRDVDSGETCSPTFEPCQKPARKMSTQFALGHSSFSQESDSLQTTMEICISPEADVEFRKFTITNLHHEERALELTTFAELALAPMQADEAHQAFSKLFIETDYDVGHNCLLARKRPRHQQENGLWAYHTMALISNEQSATEVERRQMEHETDRHWFIGRGYSGGHPRGLLEPLKGTTGAVVDPAFIMRKSLNLRPNETATLIILTGATDSRAAALEAVQKYTDADQVEAAFRLSWTRGQIELRHFRLTQQEIATFQQLVGKVLFTNHTSEERRQAIVANKLGQKSLWSIGISGDRPIVLIRIPDTSSLTLVKKLLTCHEYLRNMGLRYSFVFLNETEEGYQQDVQNMLNRLVEKAVEGEQSDAGRIHVVTAKLLDPAVKTLLVAMARITFEANGPSLKSQLHIGRKNPSKYRMKSCTANASARKEAVLANQTEAGFGVPDPKAKPGGRGYYHEGVAVSEAKPFATQTKIAAMSESQDEASETVHNGKDELLFYNGYGGFTADGTAYKMILSKERQLPLPWINVLANPYFGTITSEKATGYTWWRNSRECKLTPWSNDPTLDTPGERLELIDHASGQTWRIGAGDVACQVTYGRGTSVYTQSNQQLSQEMTVFVPIDDPIKIIRLRVKNDAETARKLSVTYAADWVLGVNPPGNMSFVVTDWDEASQTVFAKNHFQDHFRSATAFLKVVDDSGQVTEVGASSLSDQAEKMGSSLPDCNDAAQQNAKQGDIAMHRGADSSDEQVADAQPTAAEQMEPQGSNRGSKVATTFTLDAGGQKDIYILLGCTNAKHVAKELVTKYTDPSRCESAFVALQAFWEKLLGQITVKTPSKEMNVMLNNWLMYQTLGCRMWARTAFYQAGGAYGFRDQLQDSLALLHVRPDLTRAQIILHASHQYIEGDVQHWWHEETAHGIRTRFSDDLHWLPYAVLRYLEHTGDRTILEETAPYLESAPLEPDNHERYEPTVVSEEVGTIYEHCVRALERGMTMGEHGLPLMGIGDWNDGMSRIGAEGRGESVWLGWFYGSILQQFANVCEHHGDKARAERYRSTVKELENHLNIHAWDGAWFRRAFHDQGVWLGAEDNSECRIDAIAQSWSVLSGLGAENKTRKAMASFDRELVDRRLGLAKILTPGFDKMDPSPGYIQGYPPGIRENGGQYSHGVVWSILAWTKLGEGDKAFELFNMMNPINHAKTSEEVLQYRGEPYVMAADVYTSLPHEGQSGWTWYTGASGWMYQAGIEGILGLTRRADKLHIKPCIPASWPEYEMTYRFGESIYHFTVKNKSGTAGDVQKLVIDGVDAQVTNVNSPLGVALELSDDGATHEIEVEL